MVDYAQHLIRIDQLAREAHDRCLDKRYLQARNTAMDIMTEARLLAITLAEMHEQEEVRNSKPA